MPNYDLTNLKIIVVEDSDLMRAIIRGVLRSFKIGEIIEKSNGEEAIAYLQKQDVDLVISDNLMSPINGIELVSLIRTGVEGIDPFTPFIMVSGFTDVSRIIEARDAGINEYLAKPVSAKQIYQRISTIIENPRDFVRTSDFFGPDRRRRAVPISGADRRKNRYTYR